MRTAQNRKEAYLREEYTTAYTSTIWDECIVGTGAVSISSNELKLNTPANNDVAALVTKQPYYLRNFRLSVTNVDVATSAPARAGIVLAKTQTKVANPETLNDSIRFCLDAVNSKFVVTTDVGGVEKVLYNAAWTDGDGALTIDMEPDGFFRLYEDALLRLVGSTPLTSTTDTKDIFRLYIYQYTLGLAGTLGYGLFDNFQLNLDTSPTYDARGSGVRLAAERHMTPVFGRLMDMTGIADFFETDHAIDATPTQRIILSRDVKKFKLHEIKAFQTPTNAVTCGFNFYGDAQADNYASLQSCFFSSANTVVAKDTHYHKPANDVLMGGIGHLRLPGQVWFNQDWSGAPGDTKGFVTLIGEEVE
jgi:hypothetical protein